MANNVQAEQVTTAGVRFISAEVTAYGDANTHVPGCFLGIVSGSEGSQTFVEYVGGAGAVTAGTQRVTLGSDDPAVTSLAILDDWDESDRAKVNLIVGQAGISAGAGAVAANTPRLTLASDDPAVALLGTIDADTGSIVTAVQLIDDAVYTDGSGTPSKGIAVMGTDGTNPQLISVTAAGVVNVAAAQSGTWNITNISGTVSLPTGASTLAEQQTQSTHLSAIKTAVETIDNAISGSEMQVDVLTLPNVTVGTMANLTESLVDDAAFTPATSRVLPAGFTFDDTSPDTVNEGDIGAGRMSANRCQYVVIRDNAGNERGLNIDASGYLTANINGTVTVSGSGTFTTNATLQAGENIVGRVKITDGTDVADVLDLTNSNPVAVAIVDGSGTQITSFGGGTQYTEGDTDASITGTALLWEDTSDTLRAVSAAKPLPVNIISGSGSGGTASADDADFTAGTTNGTPAMGVYESTPSSVTDGDLGIVGITQGRRLKTSATIDAALPAGANAIGKLAANDGVDIGDVTINNASLAVTQSTAANLNATVVGTGTFAVQVTSLPTSTNTIEVVGDAAHDAAVAGNPVLIGLEAKDFDGAALPNVVSAEGDAVRGAASLYGVQYMMLVNEDGSAVGTVNAAQSGTWNIGTVTTVSDAQVQGKAAHDAAVSGNPNLVGAYASAAAPTDVSADGDAVRVWALRNGSQVCNLAVGGTLVTASAGLPVAQQGTWNVGTVTTVTTCSTVTTVSTVTGGGVAHDGIDSGNPIKVGARAALTLSDDTMVANGDRTDNVADADGALLVRNQFPLGDLVSEAVSNTDGASTAFSNFGATASTRNYITSIHVFRTDAGTTPIYVDFRDGTAGSVLYRVIVPAGGGAVLPASATPYFRTSANTALAYDVSAATTTVYISVSGFRSKV